MSAENTAKWRLLYQKNCADWTPGNKLRYASIPNDQTDIDDDELQSCRELVEEINGKPPVE